MQPKRGRDCSQTQNIFLKCGHMETDSERYERQKKKERRAEKQYGE
jgi:hypothetical protein